MGDVDILQAELDRAENEERRASCALQAKEDTKRLQIRDAIRDAEATARAAANAAYDADITMLRATASSALRARDAARIAIGDAVLANIPYRDVVEWKHRRYGAPIEKTGQSGVLEVWTNESLCAANLANYSIPNAGNLVIRVFKKDRTPSAKFIKIGRSGNHGKYDPTKLPMFWYPAGIDPNGLAP